MKTIVRLSLILILCVGFKPTAEKVYVCDSPASVAYHDSKECRGLKKCKHEIIYINKTDAVARGKRACKICY